MAVPPSLGRGRAHADGYVRFRALVLLSGFNDPRTHEVMVPASTIRTTACATVAYAYFEHNPDAAILPAPARRPSQEEDREFVRPALTRALAAYADDPGARDAEALVMQGQDSSAARSSRRSATTRGAYALAPITKVAKLEGPLQDDAVLAIGKIGDKRSWNARLDCSGRLRGGAAGIAAAICLLGVNCSSHQGLPRGLADVRDRKQRVPGIAAAPAAASPRSPWRRRRRRPPRHARRADARPGPRGDRAGAGRGGAPQHAAHPRSCSPRDDAQAGHPLLREAFDMLEEDLDEERFFATVRRAYWAAPAGGTVADTWSQARCR